MYAGKPFTDVELKRSIHKVIIVILVNMLSRTDWIERERERDFHGGKHLRGVILKS